MWICDVDGIPTNLNSAVRVRREKSPTHRVVADMTAAADFQAVLFEGTEADTVAAFETIAARLAAVTVQEL